MSFLDKLVSQKTTGTNQPVQNTAKKILILEDEPLLAQALQKRLTSVGYQVFHAENGQVGLDLLQQNHPDIILLDLLMPVMDGKTFLKNMRDIPEFKNLTVLVLTNAGDIDNLHETKTYYNVSEFLVKSNISLDEIVQKVHEWI